MNLDAHDITGSLGTAYVDYTKTLGRGATGTVYAARLKGKLLAAKIYHSDQKFPAAKIKAMLGKNPVEMISKKGGETAFSFAWPIAVLNNDHGEEVGFLMPLMDLKSRYALDHFYDQTLFKKLNAPEESAISLKLEIAQNLSRAVEELHKQGHCFVDMKPQNIRVTIGTHHVTLLDCDGFLIAGNNKRKFPAQLVSTDYISPEAIRDNLAPSSLGLEQDRYALAVIIFQLLNFGTHPFQGVQVGTTELPATNDEKAAQGFYPHGLTSHPSIKPRPQSIHMMLDNGIRGLFDQAFIGAASARPSAADWRTHIENILKSKKLVRCKNQPDDFKHIHFRDMACPACYLSSLPKKQTKKKRNIKGELYGAPSSPTQQASYSPTSAKQKIGWDTVVLGGVALYLGVLIFTSWVKSDRPAEVYSPPTPSYPSNQTQPTSQPTTVQVEKIDPVRTNYVSIYVSENRAIGYSLGQPSQAEANISAYNQCVAIAGESDAGSCSLLISGAKKCIALAVSSDGTVGAAAADSITEAKNLAIKKCKSMSSEVCEIPAKGVACE